MKLLIASTLLISCAIAQEKLSVDFRFKPPEWQTAICLPDDPQKTLVDHQGRLLYSYREGTRFNVVLGLVIAPNAKRVDQCLLSPRLPIVRTTWEGGGLKIVQEAFAVTDELRPSPQKPRFVRGDSGRVLHGWARPKREVNPLLSTAAINETTAIRYELPVRAGSGKTIALAICEGFWDKKGIRTQTIHVEGAKTLLVDTVKDLGKDVAGAFWFAGADVNHDGHIDVEAAGPRGAIINGLWSFTPGTKHNNSALLAGKLDKKAEAVAYAADHVVTTPRSDAIVVRITNTSDTARHIEPKIVIDALVPVQVNLVAQQLRTGSHEAIQTSLEMTAATTDKRRQTIMLKAFDLAPGRIKTFHLTRTVGSSVKPEPSVEKAMAFWNKTALPYGRVVVPDKQIQALLDSSIRNIWQAREIKNGLPSFQVGPTCYRSLWIIDAAFILETATILGQWQDARQGIEHVLSRQQKDGRFELIARGHKENGIVLWTCVRHAQLTRDKQWLRSVWPKLQRIVQYIKVLRKQAMANDTPLDDGLIPPGFVDGGLACRDLPEFSNTYWSLIGLKAAADGARWIGEDPTSLQSEYDSLLAAFHKAKTREMRTDKHGNRYLPILMNKKDVAPEKGQWTFLHALHPGQIFAKNDPLIAGNMAMLKATEKQGMVVNTGWLDGGVWTYFAPFYAHAWLWLGEPHKAVQCLYAMANHAAPTLVWQEEQPLLGETYRRVGDMPHNWASADFIRLTIHLLAFERGDELHLLEGLPAEWLKPGMTTKLDGVLTSFGPLTMSLTVAKSGKTALLQTKKLATSCKALVVHQPNGKVQRLKAGMSQYLTIAIGHNNRK